MTPLEFLMLGFSLCQALSEPQSGFLANTHIYTEIMSKRNNYFSLVYYISSSLAAPCRHMLNRCEVT